MNDAEVREWMYRRSTPPNRARRLAKAAEHEAAHAIVADSLDAHVDDVWIDEDGYGRTEFVANRRSRADLIAIATAPLAWMPMRWQAYPEGDDHGCAHHLRGARLVDAFTRQQAGRIAVSILRERHDDVLAFADALVRVPGRAIRFHEWAQMRGVSYAPVTSRPVNAMVS